jgi:hypothetical protein
MEFGPFSSRLPLGSKLVPAAGMGSIGASGKRSAPSLEQLATRLELLGQREADLSRLLRGIAGCFEGDEIEIEDEEEAPYADEKPMSSAND